MEYKNCDWCVYRDKKNPDICKNCSNNTTKLNFELGTVDIFKLAEGLKKKQEQNDKKPEPKPEENTTKQSVMLGTCPQCDKISLFYNEVNNEHECLNLECKSRKDKLFDNVVWPKSTPQEKEAQRESTGDRDEHKGI